MHNRGAASSNPACVTIITPSVRKATGNDLMNSTSLEQNSRALALVSATLEIGYATHLYIYH